MVRKKATSRRKTRPAKRSTRYFANPGSGNDPPDLSSQIYHFSKKVLKPAYTEFVDSLDGYDGDEDKQKQIIADYAYLAGNKKIGSENTKAKILNSYLNEFGKVKWNEFKSDVRNSSKLFDPDELGRAKTQSDIPGQTKIDRALRRLVLRQSGYGVVDKGITNKLKNEAGRPQLGIQKTDQAKAMYRKLVGPISIDIEPTDQRRANLLFGKGMGKFLRSNHSKLTDTDIKWLTRVYPDKSIGEAFKLANEMPESFKENMLSLRSVEGKQFDYKKVFYDVTGKPWEDPESMKDVGDVSGDYDKDLALAFNEALGLSPGSLNPMAIGAAIKWGPLKKEHGLSDKDVVKEAEGKDLEAKYIHKGTEKLGKTTTRTKALEKRAKKMGWNLKGLGEESYSKSKKKKKTGSGSGSMFSTTSSGGSPASKPKSGFFSKKTVKISPTGQFVWQKNKGALSDFGKKASSKIKRKVRPKANQRESDFVKEFGETYPKDFIDDAKRKMKEGNWFQRRLLEHEAKRMAYDVDYRGKKLAEKELDRGIAAAKYAKAQKQAQAVQRAATSPFYAAWHRFSLVTKWVIVIAIAAAVFFLPVGMFFVLGWALAVGVVALMQFIIWVFMEIWLLLAQALVAIISLVGQAFTFVLNYLGRSFAGLTGGEYQESSFLNVENMLMFQRLDDGTFVVSTYTDEAGAKQLLTWGQLNLTPPSFLSLDSFRPTEFDTNAIIAYIFPPIKNFFTWIYGPIADRYTLWITDPATEWYWPGIIVGVPTILIIVGIVVGYTYLKKKSRMFV